MNFRKFAALMIISTLSAASAAASECPAETQALQGAPMRQIQQTQQIQQIQQTQQKSGCRISPVCPPKPLPELMHRCTSQCPAERDSEKLHIVCILDRSGSMQRLTSDTIGGYNGFIAGQRAEAPKAVVTTVLFDNRYEMLYENVPVKEVKALTEREYYARGTTALLDAMGSTILRLDGSFKETGTCPRSQGVIFMIMTDGLENASREFSRADVKKLVSDAQEKYGWQFIFMGANMDSVAEAGSLAIPADSAMDYQADSTGLKDAFERAGAALKSYRSQGSVGTDWKK